MIHTNITVPSSVYVALLFLRSMNENKSTKGVCRICGCTDDDPCFNPRVGNCWWIDGTHTLCSHCADEELSCDPETRHCINSTFKSDKLIKNEDLW